MGFTVTEATGIGVTVGYHRALSAEGILSLHPTAIIHDNNIGPPQVIEQLKGLNIPLKTFNAKNDSGALRK